MCGWNNMFGSNIFELRSCDIEHMCCAAAQLVQAAIHRHLFEALTLTTALGAKTPFAPCTPFAALAVMSQQVCSRNQQYPKSLEHANNPFKRFQKHTLQDCSFNSPCFSQSRVSTDSLEQCTHDLLVSYYENITEKQKNQTLTFQSLTLVVIGAPQSGTCFYLSAANTFTLLSSFSLCPLYTLIA